MSVKRINDKCITCIIEKYMYNYPETASEEERVLFMQRVLRILADASVSDSAPELVAKITAVQKEMFDNVKDFSEIKRYFNTLMEKKLPAVRAAVEKAQNSFALALRYSMLGNFIDFGAMDSVDENKLAKLLDGAPGLQLDEAEEEKLLKDLKSAKRAVFITDNCGEIVFDKLLIETVLKLCPGLKMDVIVRGAPVLNDATMEDALQVGLTDLVQVIENGTAIMGTCMDEISPEAKACIESADVVLAKGQGNFETLHHCGKNIYYLFMCKCAMFAERFGVERFSAMILNDLRMKLD